MEGIQENIGLKAQEFVGQLANSAAQASVGMARPVETEWTEEQRKEYELRVAEHQKQMEQREKEGKASHSIAQAAFILGLFAKEEIFKYGAGTDFASAISKLAIATITENGKVFE